MDKQRLVKKAENLRWMGLIAILIQLFILSYTATRTRFNIFGSHTLSDLGLNSYAVSYAAAFTLAGICLILFVCFLYIQYRPMILFVVVFLIGVGCLLVVGNVPDFRANHIDKLHTVAALLLITSMVLSPLLFSLSVSVPKSMGLVSRYYFYFYLVVIFAVIWMALRHRYLALSEIICLAVFDSWVVYISLKGATDAIEIVGRGDRT